MTKMDLRNARHPEQVRRMKALHKAGLCYFCRQGNKKDGTFAEGIREGKFWYVKRNDFPLVGSVHHYMIVPKRHIKHTHNILEKESIELFKMILWLQKKLRVSGYSVFVRSGNTKLTGATLEHIHIHFLVGGPKPKQKIQFPEKVVPVVLAYQAKK